MITCHNGTEQDLDVIARECLWRWLSTNIITIIISVATKHHSFQLSFIQYSLGWHCLPVAMSRVVSRLLRRSILALPNVTTMAQELKIEILKLRHRRQTPHFNQDASQNSSLLSNIHEIVFFFGLCVFVCSRWQNATLPGIRNAEVKIQFALFCTVLEENVISLGGLFNCHIPIWHLYHRLNEILINFDWITNVPFRICHLSYRPSR